MSDNLAHCCRYNGSFCGLACVLAIKQANEAYKHSDIWSEPGSTKTSGQKTMSKHKTLRCEDQEGIAQNQVQHSGRGPPAIGAVCIITPKRRAASLSVSQQPVTTTCVLGARGESALSAPSAVSSSPASSCSSPINHTWSAHKIIVMPTSCRSCSAQIADCAINNKPSIPNSIQISSPTLRNKQINCTPFLLSLVNHISTNVGVYL